MLSPVNIAKFLRALISKNICERLLLIAVIYCAKNEYSYPGTTLAFCFFLKQKITLFFFLSFVFIRFITRCNLLSFLVTRCTIRCHSLYHPLSLFLPLVCLFINDPCPPHRLGFTFQTKTFLAIYLFS